MAFLGDISEFRESIVSEYEQLANEYMDDTVRAWHGLEQSLARLYGEMPPIDQQVETTENNVIALKPPLIEEVEPDAARYPIRTPHGEMVADAAMDDPGTLLDLVNEPESNLVKPRKLVDEAFDDQKAA